MKNILYIILACILFLPTQPKAETYDQKQGKSYQQIWANGAPVSKAQFRAWLSLAASSIFDFSHETYDEKKLENKIFFTTLGYMSFYKALDDAKMQDILAKNKQSVSGYLLALPRISQPILKNERYQWNVELIYALAYETENAITTQKLHVYVTVEQKENTDELDLDDDLSALDLLGIRAWVAEPMEDGTFVCEASKEKITQIQEDQIDELQDENTSLKGRLEELLNYIQSGGQK